MKNLMCLLFIIAAFTSCKKSNNQTYKVKYVVTGSAVNQFKLTVNSNDKVVATPYTGTRDTTIYTTAGVNLKLDTKASGLSPLIGYMYVNDVLVTSITDADSDGDNKTQVKLTYDIPQ